MLVASLTVFFRDLEHITDVVMSMLFYATPIIYAADRVPERYDWVTKVNPLAPLAESWRTILLDGDWPAADLVSSAGLTVILLVAGWFTFRKLEDAFADAI
jgi:ABC-type polysaccharide/polyol phosphate export permease